MKESTKSYIKAGVGLVVSGIIIYGLYKFVNKKIIEKKLRESKKKEDILNPVQAQPKVVKAQDLVASVGKMVYPKGEYVNVRSSAEIDNGYWGGTSSWFNNFIGKVVKNYPVGKVLEATIMGDNYVWYKVAVIGQNLREDKDLGKPTKDATTGFVREDNVVLK